MEDSNEIINRVAASPLVTFDLNDYYPAGTRTIFDLKENLYQGMILREKDFREFVKNHDWTRYNDHYVAITCSADAIVPVWAYMLVASKLSPHAKKYCFGDMRSLEMILWKEGLAMVDLSEFNGAKVVVKGCGKNPVPEFAFVEAVRLLQPHVSSIMYGEPCSTVPVYKSVKR